MCAVPGCKSKFLWTIGVNLSSFGVPQPTDPKFKNVWLKWLHALGISSSEEESRTCSRWARICELHFSEDCFVKDWEHAVLGKKARSYKRLVPGRWEMMTNLKTPNVHCHVSVFLCFAVWQIESSFTASQHWTFQFRKKFSKILGFSFTWILLLEIAVLQDQAARLLRR